MSDLNDDIVSLMQDIINTYDKEGEIPASMMEDLDILTLTWFQDG